MALQDKSALSLDAISILADSPQHPNQPALEAGVHIRWTPGPARGFPLKGGYHLFRRLLAIPREVCLAPDWKGKTAKDSPD